MTDGNMHVSAGDALTLSDARSRKLTLTLERVTAHLGSVVTGNAVDWNRIGDAIQRRMDEMGGISQNSLAEAAGISPTTLRDLIHARKDSYRRDKLVQVSQALGWGTDGLLRIGAGEDPKDIERELALRDDQGDVMSMLGEIRDQFGEIIHRLERLERRDE